MISTHSVQERCCFCYSIYFLFLLYDNRFQEKHQTSNNIQINVIIIHQYRTLKWADSVTLIIVIYVLKRRIFKQSFYLTLFMPIIHVCNVNCANHFNNVNVNMLLMLIFGNVKIYVIIKTRSRWRLKRWHNENSP